MATYKTGWIKKLINGVSTKVFAFAHVKTVYYNYANSKTLKSKLDDMDTSISGKASSSHTHDDRYYTESEINTKLNGKANSSHSHRSLTASAGSLGSRTVDLYVDSTFRLRPNINGGIALGDGNVRWGQIYSTNSSISTSDKNYKKNIKNLKEDERFYQLFKKLAPVSYLFTDGSSGRTHVGFIAQDVEAAMIQVGLTDLDFAGFCKDIKMKSTGEKDENGNIIFEKDLDEYGNEQYVYALRYEEFIAINTMIVQKLEENQIELEEKVNQLFDHLNLN